MLWILATGYAADADPFRPSGSLATGQGTLQGESPFVEGHGGSFGVLASFAQDLAERDDGTTTTPLVRSVLPVELYGGWAVRSLGIRFEAFAPIYAYTEAPITGYQGAALGDLRLQANIPVLREYRTMRFGIVPRVELPTGTRRAQTRRGWQAGLTTTVGGEAGKVGWLVNAGVTVSEADTLDAVGLGSTLEILGGGWYAFTQDFRVGAEAEAQVGLVKRGQGTNTVGTWSVYAQPRLRSGVGLTVGAGTGLIDGVGAPTYRVFGALTYQKRIRDRDLDGIVDPDDACPTEPEDLDAFEDTDGCPEADNDNDTLADVSDVCPNEPEDFDGFQDEDGCPEDDNDGDGLLDADDACPDEPGPAANKGCPEQAVVDTDGDGVLDPDDACPDVPGPAELKGCPDRDGDRVPDHRDLCPDDPIPAEEDPATSDGCPKAVYITRDEIKITQRIEFETGRSEIRPVSFGILDQVASLMTTYPAIRKLEVGGHTDNVGSDSYNQKLSQARADAVRTYLLGKGVSRNRVVSEGFGETKPRDTNRTDEGRQNNRRVEFRILEQDEVEVEVVAPTPKPAPAPAPAPRPQPATPVPGPVPGPTPAPAPTTTPDTSPWDAPKPAPAKPAPTDLTIETSDLQNPWGDATPKPTPAPSSTPWGDPSTSDATPAPKPAPRVVAPAPPPEPPAAPAPKPQPAPRVAPEPAPEPAPAPRPEPADPAPITAPLPLPAPAPSGTLDPTGPLARLTIRLEGGYYGNAVVYVDNVPLKRTAPFSSFPLTAGEHQIWVRNSDGAIDVSRTLPLYNGQETTWVLPDGEPTYAPYEDALLPAVPAPAESSSGGRRSKKRKNR